MYGFTESLNVSVAAALVLHTLIAAIPSIRGDLTGPGRAQQLEAKWRAAAARAHDNRAGVVQQKQHGGRQQCCRISQERQQQDLSEQQAQQQCQQQQLLGQQDQQLGALTGLSMGS